MGLWRITKDGATIGHVATPDGEADPLPVVMEKATLWGVVPSGAGDQYGATWVPSEAIEDEARQRIRSIPTLAPFEELLIASAKHRAHMADALDTLRWLTWGHPHGIRHWATSGAA